VADYLADRGEAPRFFPGPPDRLETYRDRARAVDERMSAEDRRRAAEIVSAPHDEARRRLDALVEEGGFFVTTGQQPGLFTGPLYSLYKALTAVSLADALEDALERPVVPLFWIASEDHDWAEANHTWLVDLDNDLVRISLPAEPPASGEPPLFRIALEEELEASLAELTRALPETDFSGSYLELIRDAYAPGATLPGGFRSVLEALLGPFGVCFVEAHQPGLKEASRPVLLRELDRAEAHEALLAERARALEEAGYHVQVPILEGGVNLFLEGPEGRERLYRDEDGFRLHRSGLRLDRDELLSRRDEDPRLLSPNVLLRPVVESAVFPTVAYVAGPGEIAYFAELAPLFEAHGLGGPVVAPRTSVTLVESKNRKVLDKFELEVGDLDRPLHELESEVARDEVPPEIQQAIGRLRGAIAEHSSRLIELAREVDPTLKGPIGNARNTAFSAFGDAEKKIVQAVKRENEIALEQLEKARIHLFPDDAPQERRLNVLYYLVRYGEDFLPELAEACSVDLGAGPA